MLRLLGYCGRRPTTTVSSPWDRWLVHASDWYRQLWCSCWSLPATHGQTTVSKGENCAEPEVRLATLNNLATGCLPIPESESTVFNESLVNWSPEWVEWRSSIRSDCLKLGILMDSFTHHRSRNIRYFPPALGTSPSSETQIGRPAPLLPLVGLWVFVSRCPQKSTLSC